MEDRCLLSAFVVDTVVDESDGDLSAGDLSLREAIEAANAQAGADTISFSPTVFGTAQTIDLVLGEFAITDDLTITGPGRDLLTIDAQGNSRHFNIDDGDDSSEIDVSISAVTLTNGFATDGQTSASDRDSGGAVFATEAFSLSLSRVTSSAAVSAGGGLYLLTGGMLSDVEIRGNTAQVGGGGIFNFGTLTIEASFLTNNRVDLVPGSGGGGGIWSPGGNTNLQIHSSVIQENIATDGTRGGGVLASGTLGIYDSVISLNTATSAGGGIAINVGTSAELFNTTITRNEGGDGAGVDLRGELESFLTITNSTIAENVTTRKGGGLFTTEHPTRVNITNTIIAGNEETDLIGNRMPDDIHADHGLTSSYSFIGDPATTGGIAHGTDGNIVGQDDGSGGRETLNLSTVLGPLADNGGLTQTHALLPGSIAINAGDPAFNPNSFDPPLTTDQRGVGFARVTDGGSNGTPRIDIGAFEFPGVSAIVPTVSISDATAVDEGQDALFVVTLSSPADTEVSVRYSTTDGSGDSAIGDVDFVWQSAELLTFQSGETQKTIAVTTLNDSETESPETFGVALSVPVGVTIAAGTAVGTINDSPVPPAPTVFGPASTTKNLRPTVSWSPVAGATSYELWLQRLGGENNPVANPVLAETSYQLTSDLQLGRYRSWVRAIGPGGHQSAWASRDFRVSVAPVLDSLSSQHNAVRPQISWNGLPGVNSYRVYIQNRTTGNVVHDEIVTTSSFTPSTDLPFGQHQIRVRGIGPDGYQAGWSVVERHTVGPRLVSPIVSTFDTQPQFSWTAVSGVASYQLYVQRGRDVIINESDLTSPS